MLNKLAEVEFKTHADVLSKCKTDALVHTLADRLREVKVETLQDDALADRLTKVEVHMRGNALAKVDSRTVAYRIALKKVEKLLEKLAVVNAQAHRLTG